MATPPTRVSYNTPATGNFSSTATSRTTASFNVTAGDIIVVLCSIENGGAQTVVTPSASGGSVTWTQQVRVPAASNANTSGAWCWTGAVGATATGITVTLNRPSTDTTLWWGMSATVYTSHGGVGVAFNGTNGTGANSAPSVSATCSANSAVVCQINDWNAADGTSRVWRTINGAAETETVYFTSALHHTVYGAFRADTGAAGSITQGLTAPTGQRWVLAGVEILGVSGATNFNVTATSTSTATTTAAAVVGKVGGVSSSSTASITSTAVVGASSGASLAATATISATAVVGVQASATLSATDTITTAGTVTSGSTAGATLGATGAITSSAVVGAVTSVSLTATGALSAAATLGFFPTTSLSATGAITAGAQVGKVSDASLSATATITAVASLSTGATSTAALAATGSITATAVVGKVAGASLSATATVTPGTRYGRSIAATLSSTAVISAVATLTEIRYRFSPPTHEEPIRIGRDMPARPIQYYRLTYASSVVKVGGTFVPVRTPTPEALAGLVEGVDFFRGGYEYEVSQSVANQLIASGYSPTLI